MLYVEIVEGLQKNEEEKRRGGNRGEIGQSTAEIIEGEN